MARKKERYTKHEVMKELGFTNSSFHRWKAAGKLKVQPAQPAYVTHADLLEAKKIKREIDKTEAKRKEQKANGK